MGAVSAGTEEDAGTRYPTVMQDTNGNQIYVRYYPGAGVTWTDSSARIKQIEDVRTGVYGYTYYFSYTTTGTKPHLYRIWDYVGSGAGRDFT